MTTTFGGKIPFTEPNWYQGWNTVYYKESHVRVRDAARQFIESEIMPHVQDWEDAGEIPAEFRQKLVSAGIYPMAVGSPLPVEYFPKGYRMIGDVDAKDWDRFHHLVVAYELSRCGSGGVLWGLLGGLTWSLAPILHHGSKELKERVAPKALRGELFLALCITEPGAGSDVAGLQGTTAGLSSDTKNYIIDGQKKWITNGMFADGFIVAVRIANPSGPSGLTLLYVERSRLGVSVTRMQCMGARTSGTAVVTFDGVKVPIENRIGVEHQGFKYIVTNFNHERWSIAANAISLSRVCISESYGHALKRKTFGKKLVEHGVIRQKLGNMVRQVEAAYAWLEQITFEMSRGEWSHLGGSIALLKAHSSLVLEYCAREASQIFGGLAYTQGGLGGKIERIYREVRGHAIPGGSEEILLDLGVREALKRAKL